MPSSAFTAASASAGTRHSPRRVAASVHWPPTYPLTSTPGPAAAAENGAPAGSSCRSPGSISSTCTSSHARDCNRAADSASSVLPLSTATLPSAPRTSWQMTRPMSAGGVASALRIAIGFTLCDARRPRPHRRSGRSALLLRDARRRRRPHRRSGRTRLPLRDARRPRPHRRSGRTRLP